MKLTVIGPNLRDQSKGQLHVHVTGCADITRGYDADDQRFELEASSVQEVVTAVYPEEDFGYDFAREGETYVGEFHFAPCVNLAGSLWMLSPRVAGALPEVPGWRRYRPEWEDAPPSPFDQVCDHCHRIIPRGGPIVSDLDAGKDYHAKPCADEAAEAWAEGQYLVRQYPEADHG